MSRDKIFVLLHKLRACVVRQQNHECNGNCSECMYGMDSTEIVKMCDTLITMYRPAKKKKVFHLWKKKGA